MSEPATGKPATVYGSLIPTKNNRGFMSESLDQFSAKFVDYAGGIDDEVLDMGCAYGVATLAALARGAKVLACDMEAQHLEILIAETPADARSRLRTRVGTLPDVDFPASSFGAILCSRVLHFLQPDEVIAAVAKMHRWLKPGGRIFLVADSPYTGFWSSTAPDYERRKAAGDEWPGLIKDISGLLGDGQVPAGMLPYLNPMDPDILRRECGRAGFTVLEARFAGRQGAASDGRQHAGAIARKD